MGAMLGALASTFFLTFSKPVVAAGCRSISFDGEIAAGEAFVREIGGGLALHLTPTTFSDPAVDAALDGWNLALLPRAASDKSAQEDRIYPVNPPLRFNPWQQIGTSYDIAVEEKLKQPLAYAFVPGDADYRAISERAQDALWPYAAAHPEQANEAYLNALAALRLGMIRLEPRGYETVEGGRGIRQLTFTVQVIAPEDFAFTRALPAQPAPCLAREGWP